MTDHLKTGNEGELIAKEYLIAKGYKVLHTNWRNQYKELDIICQQGELLVVVEVKTRTSEYFESPKEAVTRKKQKNIIEATNRFIELRNINAETRFDIVSILLNGQKPTIEHTEDAFQVHE